MQLICQKIYPLWRTKFASNRPVTRGIQPSFIEPKKPARGRLLFFEGFHCTRSAQHLVHFIKIQLFLNNHFTGIFLKQNRSAFRDFSTGRNRPPAHLFHVQGFLGECRQYRVSRFQAGQRFSMKGDRPDDCFTPITLNLSASLPPQPPSNRYPPYGGRHLLPQPLLHHGPPRYYAETQTVV